MNYSEELLKLIEQNPNLPIIPMVNTEVVCGDEYGHWMGKIGHCEVKEFVIDDFYSNGKVIYKDDYNAEEYMIEAIAESKYDGTDEDYNKARNELQKMWKMAIVLSVEP